MALDAAFSFMFLIGRGENILGSQDKGPKHLLAETWKEQF
jgi:hypothetical protein